MFLDVRMPPGIDGIETAVRLRAIDPALHIVIVTAHHDVNPATLLNRVPPADKLLYLQKPFSVHEIRQTACALTSKWNSEQHVHAHQAQLEHHVDQRTSELAELVSELKSQIAERKRAERELVQRENRLRKQNAALTQIARAGALFTDDPTAAFHQITETAAQTLDCARVGIWLHQGLNGASRARSVRGGNT